MTVRKNQPNRTLLRTGITVFFLSFLFLGFSHTAFAAVCPAPGTIIEWFQKSDVVFLGRLTNFNSKSFNLSKFRVERTFKGILDKKIALHGWTRWHGLHQKERHYFVFANKRKQGGYLQLECSLIFEAKLGSWKKRRENWKLLVLNILAKGYDEKKIIEELFNITKTHKNNFYRLHSLNLIGKYYIRKPGGLPKDIKKALLDLMKTDPGLFFSAEAGLFFSPKAYYQSNSYSCAGSLTPGKYFHDSDAVFLGRAVFSGRSVSAPEPVDAPVSAEPEGYLYVVFKVEKTWKGAVGNIVQVILETDKIQLGKRYLVYAQDIFFHSRLLSTVCNRTRIARNLEMERIQLDKLSAGMGDKEIFKWLLATVQTHPKKKMRLQAWALIDSVFGVSTPDLPEGIEDTVKRLTKDSDKVNRQYAQTILDKIKRVRGNRKYLPTEN